MKLLYLLAFSVSVLAQSKNGAIGFSSNKNVLQTYEYWQGSYTLKKPLVLNPFTDVTV